ncbi:hypothetical protein BaRGS_00029251 [Batillaria attramentaria]|uniref:Novel STAND NTPase 3 domain-containing protein n=1 Tax=Batillaria attramentaria TaxID=370345 RepID=A0ABD0JXU1_9CAEN
MGADMTVTNTHMHDNRTINKTVQHHHGDVHHVVNKFVKKGDVIHHHGDLHHTQLVHYNENEAGYEQIKDQSMAEVKPDSDLFVKTENYRSASRLLEQGGILVITGPRGSGKSCLGHALLRYFHTLDYTPLVLRRFEEWRQHVGGDRKQIVLLEHVFGQEAVDSDSVKIWDGVLGTMQDFAQTGKCLVVFTVNDHILPEINSEHSFRTLSRCLFSLGKGHPYSNQEKREMLKNHLMRVGQTVEEREVELIVAGDKSGPLFPSRCHQFSQLPPDDPKRVELSTAGDTPVYSACGLGPKKSEQADPNSEAGADSVVFDRDSLLHEACQSGDVQVVLQLLTDGVDWTRLHLVSYLGQPGAAQVLINRGASIDARSTNDVTPLHLASRYGQLGTARVLLESGADPDARKRLGPTPLHAAAFAGHSDLVDLLITFKAKVDVQDTSGWTPLHYACQEGRVKVVESMISNTSTRNPGGAGRVVFRVDCLNGHTQLVKSLLRCGVSSENPNGTVSLCAVCASAHQLALENVSKHNAYTDMTGKGSLTALYLAAQNGHAEIVKILLEAGACPEIGSQLGWTPLHLASDKGHEEVVDLLLRCHPTVDLPLASVLYTPLHLASRQGHRGVVDRLLASGASPLARSCQGHTPLHVACLFGRGEVLDSLIKATLNLDMTDYHGSTPLDHACKCGDADVVRKLIERGATLDFTPGTSTPLHKAANRGHSDVLIVLGQITNQLDVVDFAQETALQRACEERQNKAVETLIGLGARTDVVTSDGETLLHTACRLDAAPVDLVQTLLEHGLDTEARTSSGDTALHLASNSYSDDASVVIKLLEHGAVVDVVNNDGETPVFMSCKRCRLEELNALIKQGANVNIAATDGTTPLHEACACYYKSIVQRLLEAGADKELKDMEGRTPLMKACDARKEFLIITTMLLESGVDVNAADKNGVTSLHIACRRGEKDLALALIQHGAHVSCYDNDGNTLLHEACKNGNTDLIGFLLENGANLHVMDNEGNTPLHHACAKGYAEVARLLLKGGAVPDVRNKAGNSPMNVVHAENRADLGFISMEHMQNAGTSARGNQPQTAGDQNDVTAQGNVTEIDVTEHGSVTETGITDTDVTETGVTDASTVPKKISSCEDEDFVLIYPTGSCDQSQTKQEPSCSVPLDVAKPTIGTNADGKAALPAPSPKPSQGSESPSQPLFDRDLRDSEQPLHAACRHGNTDYVLQLLQEGHGINSLCGAGRTPLHYACAWGQTAATETLLENGADVNVTDDCGRTPLQYACAWGCLVTVDILLKEGAAANANDVTGRTALHWASSSGHAVITAVLLAHKADVNATDTSGDTPLHLVSRQGNNDVAIVLLSNGADVRAKNKKRQTSLGVASASGHSQVVETLERHL